MPYRVNSTLAGSIAPLSVVSSILLLPSHGEGMHKRGEDSSRPDLKPRPFDSWTSTPYWFLDFCQSNLRQDLLAIENIDKCLKSNSIFFLSMKASALEFDLILSD